MLGLIILPLADASFDHVNRAALAVSERDSLNSTLNLSYCSQGIRAFCQHFYNASPQSLTPLHS